MKEQEYESETINWRGEVKESLFVEYKPGQIIFYEGHIPFGIFVFIEGCVALKSDRKKKELRLAPLNEPIDVDAFFYKNPYKYSAEALTHTKGYFMGMSLLHKYTK